MAAGWRTRHNTCNRTIKGISIYWPVCAVVVCVLRPLLYIYNENQQQQPALLAQQHKFSFTGGGGGGVLLIIRCRAGSFLYQSRINGHPPTPPSPFFFYIPSLRIYIRWMSTAVRAVYILSFFSLCFLSLFPYPVTSRSSTPFLFFLFFSNVLFFHSFSLSSTLFIGSRCCCSCSGSCVCWPHYSHL
jgi:hypothetical protein